MMMLLFCACALDSTLAGKDGAGFDSGDPFDDTGPPADSGAPVEECNGRDDDGDGAIDEGFPDFDGDGVADCVDDACEVGSVAATTVDERPECAPGGGGSSGEVGWAWDDDAEIGDYVVEWRSTGYDTFCAPVVTQLTDDDGDGDVDADDTPDIVTVSFPEGNLYRHDGDTGAVHVISATSEADWMSIAAADVDGDGVANVLYVGEDGVCALRPDGSTLWCSAGVDFGGWEGVAVADLEGDGVAEVIAAPYVVDGRDGRLLHGAVCTGIYTVPVTGDLDGDGVAEIVCGGAAWRADGSEWWYHRAGEYDFSSIVDLDRDGEPEVLVSAWGVGLSLWSASGTLLGRAARSGNAIAACVADFDGDGFAEIAVPVQPTLDLYDHDLNLRWSIPSGDWSGAASCSAFDFDGDGAYELVYADEDVLRVYDGATGTALLEWSDHGSGTIFEYPVIADVDGDGSAEIVVAEGYKGSTGVAVLGHRTGAWAPADGTWSQYSFDGGNVTAAGGVPVDPPDPFRDGGYAHARPPGYYDEGRGTWTGLGGLPDLGVAFVDACAADCVDGPVEVAVVARNAGAVDAEAVVVLWSVGADGDRELGRTTLPLAAGEQAASLTWAVALDDVGVYGLAVTIEAADGTGDCDDADARDERIGFGC